MNTPDKGDRLPPEVIDRIKDFGQRRAPVMLHELAWAAGNKAHGLTAIPPPWVPAAMEAAKPELFLVIQNEVRGGPDTPETLKAKAFLLGSAQVGLADLIAHQDDVERLKPNNPVLAQLHACVTEYGLSELPKASGMPSNVGVKESLALQKKVAQGGQRAARESDGGMSVTTTICHLMWMLWPLVELAENREELRQFLGEALNFRCDRKIFEKVCATIGYKKASRGRPKIPTHPKRKVGIKKSGTLISSGHDNPRRSEKSTGEAGALKSRGSRSPRGKHRNA